MKSGIHQKTLIDALDEADQILVLKPANIDWDIKSLFDDKDLFDTVEDIVAKLSHIKKGHFVVMSNGSFNNIFNKLIPNLCSL